MNLKISTKLLQDMVAKAIKGSSNNKMIPITSLLGLEVKDNTLTLMTTDGSNHLRVKEKIEVDVAESSAENFYIVVNAETFSKLIAKTTTEKIALTLMENYLEVKGNGTYKLEVAMDEDGNVIKFANLAAINNVVAQQISVNKLKSALAKAKVSAAQTMEIPFLTGYHVSGNIITTNREMMSCVNESIVNAPILISSEMAELLQLLEGETVALTQEDKKLLFETDKITIYGKQLEGLEMYPVQALNNLMNLSYNNTIKVDKTELLNVLDRMSIFVTDYDKNGVFLSIVPEGLQLTSQKSNASEIIPYEKIEGETPVTFRCLIDIEMFKSQVQVNSSEKVQINYGQEKSIKLVDENNVIVISLMDLNN